jgi:DNA-binding transcriptional ArsR family regulator
MCEFGLTHCQFTLMLVMTNSTPADQALGALGDGRRRAIVEQLALRPSSVGEIAAGLPVTSPAVSQHLRVLKEAGLVRENPEGVRRIYRLNPAGLAAIRQWLDAHFATAPGTVSVERADGDNLGDASE